MVPPTPQADAQVELIIKLVACEYLEDDLLITGSHWGSEMVLGNLISILREGGATRLLFLHSHPVSFQEGLKVD